MCNILSNPARCDTGELIVYVLVAILCLVFACSILLGLLCCAILAGQTLCARIRRRRAQADNVEAAHNAHAANPDA